MAKLSVVVEAEPGEDANLIDILKGDGKLRRILELIAQAQAGQGPATETGAAIGERRYRFDFRVPVSGLLG